MSDGLARTDLHVHCQEAFPLACRRRVRSLICIKCVYSVSEVVPLRV
mgnify:CR=1 FL=1